MERLARDIVAIVISGQISGYDNEEIVDCVGLFLEDTFEYHQQDNHDDEESE
jgi:hypothetical protein